MSNEPCGTVLKVGPHATSHVESRQARKGATVRRSARVPWEYLTGAGSALRSRDGRFEGGCTVLTGSGGERVPVIIVCGGGRTPLLPHAPPPLWSTRRMDAL